MVLSRNYRIFSILGSLTIYFLINIIGHPLCFVCFSSGAEKGAAFVEGTGWLVALVTLNFSYLFDKFTQLVIRGFVFVFSAGRKLSGSLHITKGRVDSTPRPWPPEAPHWIGLQVWSSPLRRGKHIIQMGVVSQDHNVWPRVGPKVHDDLDKDCTFYLCGFTDAWIYARK